MSTPQNAGKAAARCIWFTGLSGSGKTTLADQLAEWLDDRDISAIVLDGDQVRRGLNRDLGFSREDRRESVRRLAELAHLLVDAGIVALVSTVSPYREDRARARALFASDAFVEVHVAADLQTCVSRDPKKLYARAQAGDIEHLTGWDDPYEAPENPELRIDTSCMTIDEALAPLKKLFA